MNEYTQNGIMYTWELAGPDGAAFILFPDSKHTHDDIQKAKQYLRDSQDVVSLRVASDDDRDYIYKTAYFRHPLVRPLRWYQIEQDEKLIRAERLKGTSVDKFVEQFVLPRVKETEAFHLEKFGNKIYNQ